MNDNTTVIEVVAQVTDETESGTRSSESNISKLERSITNLYKQIQGMKGKSKLEVMATLKDMASKGIQGIASAGKKIAGKVWTVTLKAIDLVTAPFKKVLGLITNPVTQMAAFAGVSLGVADTINTFKDFEQGMANVQAISGATGTELEELISTAKKLGESTMFSAAQAAEAMENLAMAGWKSKDIISGMPGLLDLAAAGSVDLATAADVTSSALAQFKLDASESTRVADVLAATATNSKTDVAGLGESLKMAGTQAGALGYKIEDVAFALGLMGNAGVDASSAGTALRSALARMSKQEGLTAEESNAVSEAMKKVGVSLTTSEGKSKSLMTVIKELRQGFKGMTETEQAATAANLAGMYAQSGLLAIVNASEKDFNKLSEAISKAQGSAEKMAATKMNTLQGSLLYLQSAAEGVKIAIGDKLQPYVKGLVDWLTAHMPDVQNAVGQAVDFITGKIDNVMASVKSLTGSQEWQKAETLWDKIKLAWGKIIVEPFDNWWNSTGKTWLAGKANEIGSGLGTALKEGILGLLGIDVGSVVADGVSIGASFMDGFLEGFDSKKVGEALSNAVKEGAKNLASDASTLLPGGKEASGISGLSAAVLGYGAVKAGKVGYNVFKVGRAAVKGISNITGISEGIRIANAAKTGGAAAQSALAMAKNGTLGVGIKAGTALAGTGSKIAGAASKVAKVASKAAVPLAAITSAIDMGVDAYHGVEKSKEWTGSNSLGNKVASGVGAALGGTGEGILSDESVGEKVLDVGGGALKGAGIGAAIGTIIPGAGTAIGAGIGAGVGAVGAAIGGSNIAKALSTAGSAVGDFFTKTIPDKFGEFADGAKSFFNESVPRAISNVGEKVGNFFDPAVQKFNEFKDSVAGFFTETIPETANGIRDSLSNFFTETVPAKFEEFKNGITDVFTEKIPYAIGFAAGKIKVFFTETIPQKFEEFTTGISNFFTETVPNAIAAAGTAIRTFFTESVPEFFSGLWEGIVGFFTETVPAALETITAPISTFFMETAPNFFKDLWDGIEGFFTETVPEALSTVGAALKSFFTETVPDFFTDLWTDITDFFTKTIPDVLEDITQSIKTFFTETLPDKIKEIWDGIFSFFTETVPDTITSIKNGISDFFNNVKDKISGFFGNIWNSITEFFGGAKENFNAGYADAVAEHAEGGIMTKPHIGLVAEDGAEAIIPLYGKRRDRGVALWEKAGQILGIKPYANGGIIGKPYMPSGIEWQEKAGQIFDVKAHKSSGLIRSIEHGNIQSPTPDLLTVLNQAETISNEASDRIEPIPETTVNNGGFNAPITIQNLNFKINVDGGENDNPQDLAEAIKANIRGMTDEIAYQLAAAMQQVYANTPKASWG